MFSKEFTLPPPPNNIELSPLKHFLYPFAGAASVTCASARLGGGGAHVLLTCLWHVLHTQLVDRATFRFTMPNT